MVILVEEVEETYWERRHQVSFPAGEAVERRTDNSKQLNLDVLVNWDRVSVRVDGHEGGGSVVLSSASLTGSPSSFNCH